MKNSFGLKYLHKFFNIPFLQLQRETLLRQLETNQLDIDATLEELSVQQETEDQNYDIFLDMLETNKRQASLAATNGQSPASGSQSPVMAMNSGSPDCSSPGTPMQLPSSMPASPPPLAASPPPPMADLPEFAASPSSAVSSPLPPSQAPTQKRGFISRLFGSAAPETPPTRTDSVGSAEQLGKVQSVEDFIPDESLDRSFLEDSGAHREQGRAPPREQKDSDSDGEAAGTNPMVAAFQDDLDPDDRVGVKPSAAPVVPSKHVTLSSDEEGPDPVRIAADEDIDSEPDIWKPPQTAVSQKNPPSGQLIGGAVQSTGKPKRGKPSTKEESESDQEGPVASQMLSFVMDDPDFDSEDSSRAPKQPEVFPAHNHLSDSSSEDAAPSVPAPVTKPSVPAFKTRQDGDLFGLGFEEKETNENNGEDKESKVSKEKKKKKKKTKEAPEEEKDGKKKSRHKKGKEKEEGKEEKKKKPKKKKDEFDELEAFLGGGAPSRPRSGGEYEEL
ncbi:hypothetical protein XENTR_v10019958 [Xenopus tropicalis]|nr:hypothetical protein XENTR_v10019958 [Xenopus tropicalis]